MFTAEPGGGAPPFTEEHREGAPQSTPAAPSPPVQKYPFSSLEGEERPYTSERQPMRLQEAPGPEEEHKTHAGKHLVSRVIVQSFSCSSERDRTMPCCMCRMHACHLVWCIVL